MEEENEDEEFEGFELNNFFFRKLKEDRNKLKEMLKPYLKQIENKFTKQCLLSGIGFYHENSSEKERFVLEKLFQKGFLGVMISVYSKAFSLNEIHGDLVLIMGTQYYEGRENRYQEYSIHDVLQMVGRAGIQNNFLRENNNNNNNNNITSSCILFCFGPQKEFYKKFLYEPLPVESHLNHSLADHLNAEIFAKTIESKQDAIDYLTWTFMYKRLTLNPNYYNLQGTSHRHISDYLSELIESTLLSLEEAKCIAIEDETELSSLNLGLIASYYSLRYTTLELFQSSLTSKTKLKGILDILSNSSEFDQLPLRKGEYQMLRKLSTHLPLKIEKPDFSSQAVKANILLQSYCSRRVLPFDLQQDANFVVQVSVRLLLAMVDVLCSAFWLKPALACMELSQMLTQAMWDQDSPLKQIPHFTEQMIRIAKDKFKIDNVFDVIDMEEESRTELLKALDDKQIEDVAKFCNRYPNIDLKHELEDSSLQPGQTGVLNVELEREMDEDDVLGSVIAPFYPQEKSEGWWLVIGDAKNNKMLAVKRVNLQRKFSTKLEFEAPNETGEFKYTLYLMCDSYMGCDQEYSFQIKVLPGLEGKEEDEENDQEMQQ